MDGIAPVKFDSAELERAVDSWGCNCGPAAIAAITGRSLDEVRPHLGDFESKRYTNPTLMFDTLKRAGVRYSRVGMRPLEWPRHGLVRVQWGGPWMAPEVPVGARYRHTHWVGAQRVGPEIAVFDVNCMSVGGWVKAAIWETEVVPWLLRECVPRADGAFSFTHAIEVDPRVMDRAA